MLGKSNRGLYEMAINRLKDILYGSNYIQFSDYRAYYNYDAKF